MEVNFQGCVVAQVQVAYQIRSNSETRFAIRKTVGCADPGVGTRQLGSTGGFDARRQRLPAFRLDHRCADRISTVLATARGQAGAARISG